MTSWNLARPRSPVALHSALHTTGYVVNPILTDSAEVEAVEADLADDESLQLYGWV